MESSGGGRQRHTTKSLGFIGRALKSHRRVNNDESKFQRQRAHYLWSNKGLCSLGSRMRDELS